MLVFSFISLILLIVAIVFLFGLTPDQITADIFRIVAPKQSIRDKAKVARGQKKSRKLSAELSRIQTAMNATGKGGQFATICAVSLALFIGGGVFAVMIDNVFLIPIIAVAFCLLPFVYAKSMISHYDKHIEQEMETALSVVTTSYIRSDDIVSAVRENIAYLKPPITGVFQSFLGDATAISADITKALYNLKGKIDNQIFREWVDTLIQCQDDRTVKDTLLPIVSKLTDVRIVNGELKTMLYEPRKEYYMMVAMVVGNIPLLYMLNKDWFHTLMDTVPGKIVLAICGLVIIVTAILMMKYTKPIEYRR